MKILVVEDDALVGLGLEDEISKAGHTVLGPVPSTEGAILLARSEAPALALIDLDMNPSQDPISLARELGRMNVKSLFATTRPHLALAHFDAAIGVILKPFNLDDIPAAFDVVAKRLAGGRPPPPPIPSSVRLFS
jgi:DNA-binding NarL/FixJ family response regulator